MKKITIFITALLTLSHLHAQFELDGTAELLPYYGFQGDLIEGVSNLPAYQKPVVRHVYLVKPDIIAITIDALGIDRTGIRHYDPHESDSIIVADGNHIPAHLFEMAHVDQFVTPKQRQQGAVHKFTFIYRNGEHLGWLVGPDQSMYWPIQPAYGERLETSRADKITNYKITSPDDSNFKNSTTPISVHRKTKPREKSSTGPAWGGERGERHELYLQLPAKIKNNMRYILDLSNLDVQNPKITFRFNDNRLRTEAIHVNQVGYHTGQKPKKAFLSTWMGPGGKVSYDEHRLFTLVELHSGKPAMAGNIVKILSAEEPEIETENTGSMNFHKTDVYELDFSLWDKPGTYYIVIPEIGRSFEFTINDKVWEDATKLQMMGFLHQRSGIELGAPYTEYKRPRNFHPEDHFTVHECDPNAFFEEINVPGRTQHRIFDAIKVSLIPGSSHPGAWGGWADAADYDRRIQHFAAVKNMLELYEYAPDYFNNLSLQLPEADNHIPDIIDEALWCTEMWRRTQTPDGGATIGIESITHPRKGETSWMDALPVALMPPTPEATFNYAVVAAQMAHILENTDRNLAGLYTQSALKAMEWAQKNENDKTFSRFQANPFEKAEAYLAMYILTDEQQWHEQFKKQLQEAFPEGISNVNFGNGKAVMKYALLSDREIDKQLQQQCKEAVIASADDLVKGANETTLGVIRRTNNAYTPWIVETRDSQIVIVAHLLTKDSKYLESLVQSSQFGMGANPLNLVYTTGLGNRYIYPFHLDSEYGGIPVPSGIPAYGPYMLIPGNVPENSFGWDQNDLENFKSQLHPSDATEWPWLETYFRFIGWPGINEFTVQQGMRDQMLRWGYLGQYYSNK